MVVGIEVIKRLESWCKEEVWKLGTYNAPTRKTALRASFRSFDA